MFMRYMPSSDAAASDPNGTRALQHPVVSLPGIAHFVNEGLAG
jgi:hypothetical protein